MDNRTIAAVSSGMTASGIGIIRISGPEAFLILSRIFRPRKKEDVTAYPTHTIHYGHIVRKKDEGEEVLDECLAMVMRGPHTYTTEDTVEINTHGGPFCMQCVLDLILENGAFAAEPGEFTKRAYLGGRIDLSEAEAVMDVISAKSEDALVSSLCQLSGSVRKVITDLRETLLNELAFIEAAIDDPEHYEISGYGENLLQTILPVEDRLKRLLKTFGEGRYIKEGILTVICGKPNAGKSSLLNALIGEDRAIVTEIEGTTRDTLEEQVRVGGLMLRIIDTAGIREARDQIERIGIDRAKEAVMRADLLLAVFDSARPLDDNDMEILSLLKGRQALILLNKSDLDPVVTAQMLQEHLDGEMVPIVTVSAREHSGMEQLEQEIRTMFFGGKFKLNEEAVITNARHRQAISEALASLQLVKDSIRDGLPEDFYSIDLMDAYAKLGEIIGEGVGDDLVDAIFSKFCMGK